MVNFENVNRLDELIQKLWKYRLSPKTPTVRTRMVSMCYNLQPISSFVLHFSVALAPFCYDLYAVFLNAAKLPYPGADRSDVD